MVEGWHSVARSRYFNGSLETFLNKSPRQPPWKGGKIASRGNEWRSASFSRARANPRPAVRLSYAMVKKKGKRARERLHPLWKIKCRLFRDTSSAFQACLGVLARREISVLLFMGLRCPSKRESKWQSAGFCDIKYRRKVVRVYNSRLRLTKVFSKSCAYIIQNIKNKLHNALLFHPFYSFEVFDT